MYKHLALCCSHPSAKEQVCEVQLRSQPRFSLGVGYARVAQPRHKHLGKAVRVSLQGLYEAVFSSGRELMSLDAFLLV